MENNVSVKRQARLFCTNKHQTNQPKPKTDSFRYEHRLTRNIAYYNHSGIRKSSRAISTSHEMKGISYYVPQNKEKQKDRVGQVTV